MMKFTLPDQCFKVCGAPQGWLWFLFRPPHAECRRLIYRHWYN